MDEKAFFERLDRHNDIIQKMLDIMSRPANKFTTVLETVVLIASAFGFIGIADIIIKWVSGIFYFYSQAGLIPRPFIPNTHY